MLKEKEVNGIKFHLVARSWSTSRAWGHIADLYRNGELVNTVKCRYYNRTWECYQYQSVIKSCLYSYIEEEKKWELERFKRLFNVKRMTKHLRETFGAWLEKEPIFPVIKGLETWQEEL